MIFVCLIPGALLYGHAEHLMIEDLKKQTNGITRDTLELMVYINRSPCSSCSEKLINFQSSLTEHNIKLRAVIQFSNFHKIYPESTVQDNEHMKGLRELFQEGFDLKIFKGRDDWKRFLDDVNEMTDEEKEEVLAISDQRKDREKTDYDILQRIISPE